MDSAQFPNLHHTGAESWFGNYEMMSQGATGFPTEGDMCGTMGKQQARGKEIRSGVWATGMKPVANINEELDKAEPNVDL